MTDDGLRPDFEAEPSPRQKPPLWHPKPEPQSSLVARIALGIVAAVVGLGGSILLLEPSVLSVPAGQLEVQVVSVQDGQPPDEMPAAYRHLVRLRDGTERTFVSQDIHRPGERLVVFLSRGLVTGRTWLGSPYAKATDSVEAVR